MINNVVLAGRLTADPEVRYTTNNIANCNFTIAVNRTFKDQNGETKADFIRCKAWRQQAENMARFLKKGALIAVKGRIETGKFQGQDGQMRYTTDVVADNVQFLESKSNNQDPNTIGNWYPGGSPESEFVGDGESEMPF